MSGFVVSDSETTGTDTKFDQILQAASIYTDENFNEIDHFDLRCRRLPHVLPAPGALAVTHVDPFLLRDIEMSHFEMAREIHARWKRWAPAIFTGYNTLQFDEEIFRQTFYQNLLDPYVTNTNGSTRIDLLQMVRVAAALRPDVLVIANHPETGNPILKLDRLAPANGFDGHDAHDALGDIRATIYIARLVRERARDVWDRMMQNNKPVSVDAVVNDGELVLMTHFGRPAFYHAIKVGAHQRQVMLFDLSQDPTPYLGLKAEALIEHLGKPGSPFQRIQSNKQPSIFAFNDAIVAEQKDRLATPESANHLSLIRMTEGFVSEVTRAMALRQEGFAKAVHVEEKIYDGFYSRPDKDRMAAFHNAASWNERLSVASGFTDQRLRDLSLRLIWANAPELMPQDRRDAFTSAVIEKRFLAEEAPWTTMSKAKAEIEKLDGHALQPVIAEWYRLAEAEIAAKRMPL